MRRDALRFIGSAVLVGFAAPVAAAARDSVETFFMPFFGDLKAELEVARERRCRGIVLIYEMDGCPFCERLKRVALRLPEVRQYYHANFQIFRIDVRGSTALTTFDGDEITESSFAIRQRVRATPTTAFHDLAGNEVTRLLGPPTDAAEFLMLGRYVAGEHYKSVPFAAFRQAQKREAR